MNVVNSILDRARTRPTSPALVANGSTITFGELSSVVKRTASNLILHGVRRGERVGLCLKDSPQHLIAIMAVAYCGGVSVSLDWRARPIENNRFISELGLEFVIAEPDVSTSGSHCLITWDEEWRRSIELAEEAVEAATGWDDPFAISASSGSTGVPKFTAMTHGQYAVSIAGMLELMALAGRQRFLCTMPLHYSGGRNSCIFHLLRGDCVILHPPLMTASRFLEVVESDRITVAGVVPSAIRQLLAVSSPEPLFKPSFVLFSTGAPLHAEEKIAAVQKLTPRFCERYGTAETLAISLLRVKEFAGTPNTVGQPHSMLEVQVVDEQYKPLDCGEIGILRLAGPGLASPLNDKDGNGFRDGWFYPGEIAYIDEQGFIYLQGRTSEVIIRNGAKIFPAEVERVLCDHPRVRESAVIGSSNGIDEAIIAFVVVDEGVSRGDLMAHCRTRLTPHKVPRNILVLQELPKNTAGKVDKLALRGYLSESPLSA